MSETHPIVVFDGVCNFCSSTVQFILKNDVAGRIRFTPFQSPLGRSLVESHSLDPNDVDSLLFVCGDNAFVRSDAALEIARDLSWRWRWLRVFRIVPRVLRDAVYNVIARNRYRWFGKHESCFIPTKEIRDRFLDEADAIQNSPATL